MILDGRWYALYVRPRAERMVGNELRAKGYEPFVPVYSARRRWSDRVKSIELPLFPGYIFCRITVGSTGRIITTPGVIRIVGIGSEPIPIADEEIASIQRIVNAGLGIEPTRMQIGQPVEIVTGALAGVRGVLARFANGDRLVVSVSLLQRAVAVEIGRDDVMPVGPMLPAVA